MTVRWVLMIVALTGLAILGSSASGISKTRQLLNGGAIGLWDSAEGSVCCSVEDSALGLEPLHTQAVSTPADWTAPDGNGDQGLEAALSSAQTDPGIGDLEAARVAAPPQSRLRRMLSAFIDLGANR